MTTTIGHGVREAPQDWKDRFHERLMDLTRSRVRIGVLLILSSAVVEELASELSASMPWHQLHEVRLALIGVLVGILGLTLLRRARPFLPVLALVTLGAACADGALAIDATGGYASPFQGAPMLLLIGTPLLLPFTPAWTAMAGGIVWTFFLWPALAGDTASILATLAFQVTAFLLVCASAAAISASILTSRLRWREFASGEALRAAHERSEHLLLNILPKPIAVRLEEHERSIADGFEEVTVLFADIVGFTRYSQMLSPEELVVRLNDLFSTFDDLTTRHGVEKIKTIGDAYMAAAGLPRPRSDHAHAIARLALDLLDAFDRFAARSGADLGIRIGIHTGPVVAGVIGRKKFIYDLWGDTVNTASRMESHGLPGRIQVTQETRKRLEDEFVFEERGPIEVKGKGEMRVHWLVGRRGPA